MVGLGFSFQVGLGFSFQMIDILKAICYNNHRMTLQAILIILCEEYSISVMTN